MSIISISGRIGAGKDTVGKIIQYLTLSEEFSKTTADIKADLIYGKGYCANKSSWKIKKFASKLKEVASIITGIPVEKFEDQEFKKTFLGEEWDKIICCASERRLKDAKCYDCTDYVKSLRMTARDLLQKVGTECFRDNLHVNTWCNALFSEYKGVAEFNSDIHTKDNSSSFYPNWIITDTRFPNEIEAIKKRDGICVRVTRHQHPNDIDYKTLHPSETALDKHVFDYELDNFGDIEKLIENVRKMLIHFKII